MGTGLLAGSLCLASDGAGLALAVSTRIGRLALVRMGVIFEWGAGGADDLDEDGIGAHIIPNLLSIGRGEGEYGAVSLVTVMAMDCPSLLEESP